jgi:23S rRNA (guanosine2251-2'-O)-methyltransferase
VDNVKLKLDDLNRLTPDEFRKSSKMKVWLVCDHIRSGMNVGSVFRTADAFGVEKVVLIGYTPQPPNKEVLKTALGATETVNWVSYPDIAEFLQACHQENVAIIAIEQTQLSQPLQSLHLSSEKKYAVVMGNEVEGVSDEIIKNADLCIEIPQVGTKHSLNVSVCAGIVTWHIFHQLT